MQSLFNSSDASARTDAATEEHLPLEDDAASGSSSDTTSVSSSGGSSLSSFDECSDAEDVFHASTQSHAPWSSWYDERLHRVRSIASMLRSEPHTLRSPTHSATAAAEVVP